MRSVISFSGKVDISVYVRARTASPCAAPLGFVHGRGSRTARGVVAWAICFENNDDVMRD